MIKRRWVSAALVLVACGGGAVGPAANVHPATSASSAVTEFLQAVTDSNVAGMAQLWGTTAGPAARTRQPADYARRIAVMQAYLRHDDARILSDTPDQNPSRHNVMAQLRRSACTWNVPFVAIQLPDQNWIVNSVDVATAGNPQRPCEPGSSDGTGS